MKHSDINTDFLYQKDRSSTKGKKKNYLRENDGLDRKRKIAFKAFLQQSKHSDDYSDFDDQD